MNAYMKPSHTPTNPDKNWCRLVQQILRLWVRNMKNGTHIFKIITLTELIARGTGMPRVQNNVQLSLDGTSICIGVNLLRKVGDLTWRVQSASL